MRRLMVAFLAVSLVSAAAGTLVSGRALAQQPAGPTEVATFAGGCFWCVEADFDKVEGVLSTVSGYMGGTTPNPTYQTVTAGGTGHFEVVQITFDPARVGYQKLVDHFWRTVDPYDAGGQFCDRGDSYRTAIFAHTPAQRQIADASKAELARSGPVKTPLATEIRDAGPFTAAEDYHQDYYTKNPVRYRYYRFACGRDARVEAIWGKKAGH